MGTIIGDDIVARAAQILQDVSGIRWPTDDRIAWLNAGIRQLVSLRPEAYVINEALKLAAGTKQALPDGGTALIDMPRNMGADGATPGRVISQVDRSTIDRQNPNWHKDTASATVMHFVADERDPLHFYVYPPQPPSSQGYVEIVYSAVTPTITHDQRIPVLDLFADPLTDYVLYRCYAKDPVNADKANLYYQAFMTAILSREQLVEHVLASSKKGK